MRSHALFFSTLSLVGTGSAALTLDVEDPRESIPHMRAVQSLNEGCAI